MQNNPDIIPLPENDSTPASGYIAERIDERLRAGKSVAWFISGGSNITVAVAIRRLLALGDGELHVCLVDERYGAVGHDDSNWQKLIEAGFDMNGVVAHPVLVQSMTIEETTKLYAEFMRELLNRVDYSVGQLGIRSDGHTSGLLPHSSALRSSEFYDYYIGPDFERITSTAKFLEALDEIVLVVPADDKNWAVSQMFVDGPTEDIPSRLLKQAKKLTVFSASKGETA